MPAKCRVPEVGEKFAKWTFVREVRTGVWQCMCTCGITKTVKATQIRSGTSTGCGHDRGEVTSAALTRHGHGGGSKVYSAWKNAKQRCFNPANKKYHTYGARGITMCSEWVEDFGAFLAHVGEPCDPSLTLGRINNDLNYEPGNVEWQSAKTQARNKTNNKYVEYKGTTKTLQEWSEIIGICHLLLAARLNRLGWSVDKAFTTPVRKFTRMPDGNSNP